MNRLRPPVCLVVEPEWGYRSLLCDLLSSSGVEVQEASSDSEAIRLLRTEAGRRIQVVVCQAPPPGAKHSLVGKLRSQEETKLMPVVCLSPSNGLQERAHAFESGASAYLLRPVAPAALTEAVASWAVRPHRPF